MQFLVFYPCTSSILVWMTAFPWLKNIFHISKLFPLALDHFYHEIMDFHSKQQGFADGDYCHHLKLERARKESFSLLVCCRNMPVFLKGKSLRGYRIGWLTQAGACIHPGSVRFPSWNAIFFLLQSQDTLNWKGALCGFTLSKAGHLVQIRRGRRGGSTQRGASHAFTLSQHSRGTALAFLHKPSL